MFPAKVLHESSGSFFGPYLLSGGSRNTVWCRIGASVIENSHGGVSKHDSGVPIDTVAVSELVIPAKELHESSGSFFGPYLLSEG